MTNALQTREELPLVKSTPTVADMLSLVVERGISTENVAAFKELVQLHREEVKLNAEKEFAAAFVELQKELPTIQGVRPVTTKTGELKFKYANFDDIDAVVRPICLKHGFSYAFRETGLDNGRVTVTMTLQHIGGHSREIPCSVRIGSGPPGATESQADMSGHAYAQRGAIESGLALRIVGQREDAGVQDQPVTEAQAFDLERRCKETNSDVGAFLRFAKADSFKKISANRYDDLDQLLTKKERAR